MATPLSKFEDITEVQLRGMIQHAKREYPFLDYSSDDALYALARLMISVDFMTERRVTPLRSSLLFLRRIGAHADPAVPVIKERDFVFLVKMFGLLIRDKQGLYEFLPSNKWIDDSEDEGKPAVEVKIDDEATARAVEMEVSDIKKHRKIHERRIDAGTNRLVRWYRDAQLAVVLADRVKSGQKIGDAREFLRTEHDVKDHEYVRIRERALEMGLLKNARTTRRKNIRVTLDGDVAHWVESQGSVDGRLHARTPTQTVNACLRDLYFLVNKTRMPAAPKVGSDDAQPAAAGAAPASSVSPAAKKATKARAPAKKRAVQA
ncbi:hypothetical protein [Burkholderia pseudomallei]|uniref:hypothetical protein n=1 Tax=Burkholderia pseudomallei TaxID=28450 RepID=UPI000A1A17F0|nr:hypothetical protein [Burkholderia pseudomallei]ARL04337.1 hypothetical protein BOC44_21465 [Burkholderia pseudomallei]